MTQAYPLSWPQGMPRAQRRGDATFKTSLASALKNVQDSLRLFGTDSGKKVEHVVISSNCSLGDSRPADPGVAVWFVWDGRQVCFAVDRYAKVEHNLQAIYHIIEARRTELRHGGLAIVRATFTGFIALPAPHQHDWRALLELGPHAKLEDAERQYKVLRSRHHPDKNGDAAKFDAVQKAWERAQEALARS